MPHAHFMPIGGKYFLTRSSVKFNVTSRWRFQRSWTRYLVCISAQLSASGTLTTAIVPSCTYRLPSMHLINVDFPHPLPPTNPTTCPGITSMFVSLNKSVSATLNITSVMRNAAPDAFPYGITTSS